MIMVKALLTCILLQISSVSYSDITPAMKKVNIPVQFFDDDLNFKNMIKSIERQEVYFSKRNLDESITFGARKFKRRHLQVSLAVFKVKVQQYLNCKKLYSHNICIKEFSKDIEKQFEAYRPIPLKWEKGYATKQTFFTAYYSPDFEASYTKSKRFRFPIYGKPKTSKLQSLTSDEINYGKKLKGKGLELLYVDASLYDIWLLHVEGGGRAKIKQEDGSFKTVYLSYAGANKKSFNMLYKYMIENGMLRKGETTIAKQREYFANHPEHRREILKSCPSFIFFKITEDEPVGVHSMPLTENRSLATDYRRFKEYGVINFITTTKPEFNNGEVKKVPFKRFFLNQDTGGAIKGNARSDLYFGYGRKAELAANYVYGLGEQYFLILK